ncbi:MAG TPA: AAA family ATPase [Nocardioidaceae bacterium]|nr:AAA family ATPase [Nocardioidaceae bacterium]
MTADIEVVELVGPPGSGKSSVADAIGTPPGTVVLKEHHAADLPALVWAAVAAGRPLLADPPPGVTRARWAAWLGRVGAAPRIVRRRCTVDTHVVVFDQGPVYTLARIAEAADRSAAVRRWHQERLAECGRLLDAVVWLDAEPDLLVERIRARSKRHRADALTPAAARALVERERAAIRDGVEALAALGVRVVELDAAQALERCVDAVRAVLEIDTPRADEMGGRA